jgi:hypothetical protein
VIIKSVAEGLGSSPTKQTLNPKFGTHPIKEGVGIQNTIKFKKI